ncbi:glycosyltransferase family 2 protein [Microcoleus sp. FACHB-SPT15]|uniref:glycosyltransferase family 2 protein n=1 Tax=Microcoleus sp. FACHB-SPT15 TaxID=2692830 RepID=UPI00177BDFEA|nr:glycosyltransferase family 2 protein [Microcoleus sp. FACHB-SPT15]MBD1804122.1 glycosyltransferase family 2 protein [Microcoleus sp. FACHB-SPT15]
MSDPQISAIICTYNREEYLSAAIDSLLQQDFYSYEVIVVDNASSDRTREIVGERLSNPRLNYVYEPILGLSVARNTGAKEARSPILAYLDDDAVASPLWLKGIYHAYQSNKKLAIAGGKVTLLWPDGFIPPKWLSAELAGNLGAYDLGEEIVYINNPNLTPRGVNYSLRRSFLEQVGGFNTKLGRIGTNLLSNEELHMTELALQGGWQVAYLPDALVAHNVALERLERIWFLNRGWWQGISECYREQLSGRAGSRQLLRGGERMARGLYKSVKHFRDPALRFDNLVYAYGQMGYLSAAVKGFLKRPKSDLPLSNSTTGK